MATTAGTTGTATTAGLLSTVNSLLGSLGSAGLSTGAANGGATAPATGATTGTPAAGTTGTYSASQAALLTAPTTTLNVSTLSSTITSVAQLVSDQSNFIGKATAATAQAAVKSGTPDQQAIVQINLLNSMVQTLNDLDKKDSETLQNTIQTWANPNQ